MELAKYKACICEGSAENAIIDILLDNDLLIFTREEMPFVGVLLKKNQDIDVMHEINEKGYSLKRWQAL